MYNLISFENVKVKALSPHNVILKCTVRVQQRCTCHYSNKMSTSDVCNGFGERNACDGCTMKMTIENLSTLPYTLLMHALFQVAKHASEPESIDIVSLDELDLHCTKGVINCPSNDHVEANFEHHKSLIFKAMCSWRKVNMEIIIEEKDIYDSVTNPALTNRQRDIDECLKHISYVDDSENYEDLCERVGTQAIFHCENMEFTAPRLVLSAMARLDEKIESRLLKSNRCVIKGIPSEHEHCGRCMVRLCNYEDVGALSTLTVYRICATICAMSNKVFPLISLERSSVTCNDSITIVSVLSGRTMMFHDTEYLAINKAAVRAIIRAHNITGNNTLRFRGGNGFVKAMKIINTQSMSDASDSFMKLIMELDS